MMNQDSSRIVAIPVITQVRKAEPPGSQPGSAVSFEQAFARAEKRARAGTKKQRLAGPGSGAEAADEEDGAEEQVKDGRINAPTPKAEIIAAAPVTLLKVKPGEITGSEVPSTNIVHAGEPVLSGSAPPGQNLLARADVSLANHQENASLPSALKSDPDEPAINGINSAQYAAQMKKSAKTGQSEQALPTGRPPGDMEAPSGMEEKPLQSWSREIAMERATIPVNLAATYNPDAKVSEPERVPDSSPSPQIRAVETEIESTVVSFRRNGLDSWIVTVKPDAHTEIRLSIAKDGEDILIAAKLERGVVDGLTEHWPGLQRDLQQRGVILGRIEAADHNQAATNSEDSQHNRGPGHRFGRFHEPEDTDPVAEAQFIERLRRGRTSAMALTSLAVEPGRRAHFESWA